MQRSFIRATMPMRSTPGVRGIAGATQHHGKELSYNNLCVELHRRQQVANLAMASDYDWDSGEARCRHQRQVRVEVECVRDQYLLVTQVTTQAPTSTKRRRAEQAATERKLGNRPEPVGERADPLKTPERHVKRSSVDMLREYNELPLGSPRLERVDHEEEADGSTGLGRGRALGDADRHRSILRGHATQPGRGTRHAPHGAIVGNGQRCASRTARESLQEVAVP